MKFPEEALLAAEVLGALPGAEVTGRGTTVARTLLVCGCPACKEQPVFYGDQTVSEFLSLSLPDSAPNSFLGLISGVMP